MLITVGVLKGIKTHEYRVASRLEPPANMWRPAIETNAGTGIGITDDNYRTAGATILDFAGEVFASSEMIVKVKEPTSRVGAAAREPDPLQLSASGTFFRNQDLQS
ncbi:hypothetical protein CQ10_40475 [Bradyrhizobium valentinum]|nr:hypothetical protein CQ10_40475 [Bradyrhizobium valentinum]